MYISTKYEIKEGLIMSRSIDREIELDPKQKVVRVLHVDGFKVSRSWFY